MNQQKNILFVEGLASFNPAIPLEILVKLHIFFLKLLGLYTIPSPLKIYGCD